MTTYNSIQDWRNKATQLFGPDKRDWKFKCCNCGNIQSISDFEKVDVPEPDNKVFFSCIGRWMKDMSVGTLGSKTSPFNYTLGGLLVFNNTEVVTGGDSKPTPVFEFAS